MLAWLPEILEISKIVLAFFFDLWLIVFRHGATTGTFGRGPGRATWSGKEVVCLWKVRNLELAT